MNEVGILPIDNLIEQLSDTALKLSRARNSILHTTYSRQLSEISMLNKLNKTSDYEEGLHDFYNMLIDSNDTFLSNKLKSYYSSREVKDQRLASRETEVELLEKEYSDLLGLISNILLSTLSEISG